MRYNKHIFLFYLIILGSFLLVTTCSKKEYVAKEPAQKKEIEYKRQMIYGNPDSIKVRKELVLDEFMALWSPQIEEIYEMNKRKLIWFRNKKIISSADSLLKLLSEAYRQGLQPRRYQYLSLLSHKGKTESLIHEKLYDNKQIATMDVLLTYALYHYASDIYHGSILPQKVDKGWEIPPKRLNLSQALYDALKENRLGELMKELEPSDPQFEMLQAALDDLKEKASKFSSVPPLDTNLVYHLYDTAAGIELLRKKLEVTGDYKQGPTEKENPYVFNEDLQQAVKRFQERNGLEVDGIIGRNTIKALNLSVDEMIAKVIINLERLRWFAHKPDEEHIVVNLADYSMHYHRENEPELSMKVITGKKEDFTPVLKDTLEYLVFNPEWKIPSRIAKEEMLPKIRQDVNYLSRNDFVIYDGYDGKEVNPANIDWASVNEDNFSYRVVQKPGRMNSLGLVKFIFPNHRSIYLHDTPADYLFSRNQRAFSHGCVRLEKPMELAAAILSDQMESPEMKIREILESEETTVVPLENPIPVHFTYYTAWVDDKGILNFREDIYNFDKLQFREMGLNRDPYIRSEYY